MATKLSTLVLVGMFFLAGIGKAGAENGFIEVLGWGGGNPEEIVPKAAEAGFTDIAVGGSSLKNLSAWVKIGKKYQIGIYATIYLHDVADWKAKHPDTPTPLQEMNEDENRALSRILKDRKACRYQYGGEPYEKGEVFDTNLLCFHHPEVAALFKKQIADLLKEPGLKGIALDYFGYRNYRCCYCSRSMELFDRYRAKHPEMPREKALEAFSLETLVAFNNELADYVRSVKPEAKVITHIYPVYLPEPLYGNRLNVDVCGQTAAWFFEPFWSYEKVKKYSQVIFGEEKRYFPRSEGSALIGIFDRPKDFAVKSPERVEKELRAILEGGGDRVQICSMNDALNNKAICAVLKKFFKKSPQNRE